MSFSPSKNLKTFRVFHLENKVMITFLGKLKIKKRL